MKAKSRVIRHKGDFSWQGIKTAGYKAKGEGDHFLSVFRRALVDGSRGEKTAFHLRYFEVAPGGFTSLETHEHEHVVIAVRGEGELRIGRRLHGLGYLDTAYIAPGCAHQLRNLSRKKPFGFFCVVDARRDRPVLIGQGDFSLCELKRRKPASRPK